VYGVFFYLWANRQTVKTVFISDVLDCGSSSMVGLTFGRLWQIRPNQCGTIFRRILGFNTYCYTSDRNVRL